MDNDFLTPQDHPQRDSVELSAKAHFPNLTFSETSVNFGCANLDTEPVQKVTMTNSSVLPVHFKWGLEMRSNLGPPPVGGPPLNQVCRISAAFCFHCGGNGRAIRMLTDKHLIRLLYL